MIDFKDDNSSGDADTQECEGEALVSSNEETELAANIRMRGINDDDEQNGKDDEQNDHTMAREDIEVSEGEINTESISGNGDEDCPEATLQVQSPTIYTPSSTPNTATPELARASNLATLPTPSACGLATLPNAHSPIFPTGNLATLSRTHPPTPPPNNLATPLDAQTAIIPCLSHLATSTGTPADLATYSPALATCLQDNSAMSALSNHPDTSGSNPFGGLVSGSFTDLLNSNDFSYTMFNSWNDPFLGAPLTSSGMQTTVNPSDYALPTNMNFLGLGQGLLPSNTNPSLGIVQPFTPIGFGGGFPTSGFNINPFGSFGSTNSCAQDQFNFNGIDTAAAHLAWNVNHTPSLQSLPTPQSNPSLSSPSEPLSDITSGAQLPSALPPTQPGIINPVPNRSPMDTDNSGTATSFERSKRKIVPSQRAQRDNAIGKENRIPPPASVTTENAENKGKKRVSDPDSNAGKAAKKGTGKRSADREPAAVVTPRSKYVVPHLSCYHLLTWNIESAGLHRFLLC